MRSDRILIHENASRLSQGEPSVGNGKHGKGIQHVLDMRNHSDAIGWQGALMVLVNGDDESCEVRKVNLITSFQPGRLSVVSRYPGLGSKYIPDDGQC